MGAAAHGGAFVSPGSGGAHGGEFVSPAKAAAARTDIKVTERPSLFRFFMFSPKVSESVLRVFLNELDEAYFGTADWLSWSQSATSASCRKEFITHIERQPSHELGVSVSSA